MLSSVELSAVEPDGSQGMSSGETLEGSKRASRRRKGLSWVLKNAGDGSNLMFTERLLWARHNQASQGSLP